MKDIEQQLKDAAKRSGRSMKNLSDSSGVPYSAVHGFLTGDRLLSMRSGAKLARVLGLELRPVKRRKG